VFTPVTEVASELSALVTAVGLGGLANAALTRFSAEDSNETASDWQLAGAAACTAAGGTGGALAPLVGAGALVGAGVLVGVDVPDEDGSAGRQPAFCAATTALKRSPATGANLVGSGVGAKAVWTFVNAVDNAVTEGVLDVHAGVVSAGAVAADDTTEGTTTAAATRAMADSGSAKAHLRNMNPPCT
jgi:hypothetical protein